MHHSLTNQFGCTYYYSKVKMLKWKLGSVCLEIALNLMQDSFTVCLQYIICSEINLDAPNGTPRGHVL